MISIVILNALTFDFIDIYSNILSVLGARGPRKSSKR